MNCKTCSKCKIEKPLSEFSKNKSGKDGLRSSCKECAALYREQNKDKIKEYREQNKEKLKEYREQNKDKIKEQRALYYEQNKDKIKEKKALYREQNKDKIKERDALYREQNREQNKDKIKEYNALYREQNKDKIKEQRSLYYEQNKDKIKEQQAVYYQQNKDKIKEYLEQNKDKIKQRGALYREQNKDKIKEQRSLYYEQNKDKIKEDLVLRYKQRNSEQPACVYQILNKQNGKVYIGQTIRGELRWKYHLSSLRGQRHENKKLQQDFDLFGEEAFEWEILFELPKDEKILLLEEALMITDMIKNGFELYNEAITIEQLQLINENETMEAK